MTLTKKRIVMGIFGTITCTFILIWLFGPERFSQAAEVVWALSTFATIVFWARVGPTIEELREYRDAKRAKNDT